MTQALEQASFRKLEKAEITWPATKTQMTTAGILIVLSVFFSYGATLKMGFLLDDYLHLDYVARVFSGDFTPFLNNFTSNWGGSDIMKSYRPVISFSIFIDYLLFHTKAFGYHFTNIVVFATCSILVSLITLEITGRLGGRSGALTALWAGLLFSVYPLHAESVAWIIGRVDSFATCFYLASLFCFLRLQLGREKGYLLLSLVFFILALASKEIAVSLPAAIALLACLPQHVTARTPRPQAIARAAARPVQAVLLDRLKEIVLATAPFLITLIVFAYFRQAIIGTTVGGYGAAGFADLPGAMKIFANRDSLVKIFVPISEEFMPVRALVLPCVLPLIVIGATFILRQLALFTITRARASLLLVPLAALLWAALALLPAFQIWHIYPNLVGSRLFFLSSAGLCIGLALMALPSVEAVPKKTFAIFSTPALIALPALYLVWFYCLQVNLGAWQQASVLLASFESQLRQAVPASPEGRITLLNLPQDYKGAGMLGRKLYLDIFNRPPLCGEDLSGDHILTIEPAISGSREFIWPGQLQAVAARTTGNVYIWSNQKSQLEKFDYERAKKQERKQTADQTADLDHAFKAELLKLPVLNSIKNEPDKTAGWKVVAQNSALLTRLDTHLWQVAKLDGAAATPLIFWLGKEGTVAAAAPANATVSLVVEDRDVGMASRCKLLWRDPQSQEILGTADPLAEPSADDKESRYLFYPARYRSYLLQAKPVEIGLSFDLSKGPVRFDPDSLKMTGDDALVPKLAMEGKQEGAPFLNWNVTAVAAAAPYSKLKFFVTDKNTTIDPASAYDLFRPVALDNLSPVLTLALAEKDKENNHLIGRLPLSVVLERVKPAHLPGRPGLLGLRQITIVLCSKDGKLMSLPSPPVTIKSID
ncbi:MAG: glycosyltransferase family 39 protein [Cyanobacteria bacterium REEB67]|nr:glycosyltransferase family 39 protein [Cyanobacteria bacterium REEB67]